MNIEIVVASPIMFKFAIGMLCLVISNLAYETNSCKRYVCFNWKVTLNELKLTCKVSKLHYRVLILNQYGTEQAQCIPPVISSKCYTYYRNGTISQNPKTNETIFTVRGNIDYHINGNWTCRHGTKRDLAQVEVTVLRIQEKYNYTKCLNNKNNNTSCKTFVEESTCFTNVLLKAALSIIGCIIVSILLQLRCSTSVRGVDDSLKRLCLFIGIDSNIHTNILVCKRLTFCLMTVLLLTAAIFCGLFDNKNCTSQWIVLGCGLVFECVNSLLFLSNVDLPIDVNSEKSVRLDEQECGEHVQLNVMEMYSN